MIFVSKLCSIVNVSKFQLLFRYRKYLPTVEQITPIKKLVDIKLMLLDLKIGGLPCLHGVLLHYTNQIYIFFYIVLKRSTLKVTLLAILPIIEITFFYIDSTITCVSRMHSQFV